MAELVERLVGVNTDGRRKLPIHQVVGAVGEQSRGSMSAAQVATMFALSVAEQAEFATLVTSVTSIPVTGSATVIADGRARRALRLQEIDHVLLLAEAQIAPYASPAAIRTRLGLP